uniref:Uncharacterized protein n=1 Tax=Anguilla anguilla TaxID=7936 RepID=A0A0E9SHL7_ANGAN
MCIACRHVGQFRWSVLKLSPLLQIVSDVPGVICSLWFPSEWKQSFLMASYLSLSQGVRPVVIGRQIP